MLQGLVAAAKTAFAMALLGVWIPEAAVVVALVAYAVYAANDLADGAEDAINRPDHQSFVAAHPRFIAALAGGAFLGATALAFSKGGLLAAAVTSVPVVAGVCYSLPPVPGCRRLKDVLVVNTAVVALSWAVTVSVLPVVMAGARVTPLVLVVTLFFFVRTAVSVEVFNVRDVRGDAATGVRTLPVVLGVDRTRQLLALLDGFALAILVALAVIPHAVLPALVGILGVSFSLAFLWFLGRSPVTDLLCLATDARYLALGLFAVAV